MIDLQSLIDSICTEALEENKEYYASSSKKERNLPPIRYNLELIQKETLSINELSSKLKLSYTKCADYVTLLEQEGLLQKLKDGREVKLISKVAFIGNTIKFEPS